MKPLIFIFTLLPLCLGMSQESAPLVTKDKFIQELSRDYDPPPPGARGISVDPPPSVTVTLFFKYNSTELADEASLK